MDVNTMPHWMASGFALVGRFSPKTMLAFRHWLKTKKIINWKRPRNMQEFCYCQLFRDDTDLDLFAVVADKYRVRKHVDRIVGGQYLNELYGTWENGNLLDFTKLPKKFVLKTNNGCATNIFVDDKSTVDQKSICGKLNHWLNVPLGYATGQIQYSKIKPLIIAEHFLSQESFGNEGLIDYKFYCIDGEPINVLVCGNRAERSHTFDAMIYDMNWNELPEFVSPQFHHINNMPKPVCFEELKEVVGKLSRPFHFSRIDFYIINNRPVFGEITMTPNMGGALSTRGDEYLFSILKKRGLV